MTVTNFPNGIDARPGGFVGDVIGGVKRPVQELLDSGAITIKDGTVFLNKAGVVAATLADPVSGDDDGKRLEVISKTAQAHTVTIAGGLNGAGASADVGTFGAAIGNRFSVVAHGGKWWISGANVNVTFA